MRRRPVNSVPRVVGELHAVDGVHVHAQELQREHGALVAHVALHHVRLDAQHAAAVVAHLQLLVLRHGARLILGTP